MPTLFWGKFDMIMGLKVAAIIGSASLIAFPSEPQFYVLCAVVVSTFGGIVLQILKGIQEDRRRRYEDTRYERDRMERLEHQKELRAHSDRVTEITAHTANTAKDIKSNLLENTVLTRVAVARADQAYNAANHVNEKIASLAKGEVKVLETVTMDTNDTVHRIEDKTGL